MPEIVELQLKADQAFDVMSQLQARAAGVDRSFSNIGSSGKDFSETFLRSERRVSHSAANLATSLLTINDPLQAVAQGFLQLEHATKLGLGLAVGLAVGVAAFEALYKEIAKTKSVEEEFRKVTERPLNLQLGLSAGDLGKQVSDQEKQNAALDARKGSTGNLLAIIASRTTGKGTDGGVFGNTASPTFVSDALARQDAEATQGSNKMIELIKAQAGAEANLVNIKLQGARGSQQDADITKAELEYTEKVAALRAAAVDNPNLYAGLQTRINALKQEKQITEDLIRKKGAVAEVDLIGSQQQADFRGTADEKKDFALQNNLESAEAKKAIVDALGNEEDKAKAVLDISKAQLAIDDRQVEKRKQAVDLSSTRQETGIKAAVAQAAVNLAPEDAQRLNLRSQVALADLKAQKARENLSIDATDISYQKALTVAMGEQQIAMANLAKFDRERVFNSTQELNNAKSKTRELQLQAAGNTFAAGQEKINAPAESQIAKLLHDNKPEIAAQVAQQADLQGEAQLGSRLTETAAQQRAREDAERAAKSAADQAHAAVLDAQNREEHGASLDPNNPVTQQLRAEQERQAQLAEAEKNPQGAEDFSSVASLAGQDFSSLASLGSLDFSGIATLAGLSISIA